LRESLAARGEFGLPSPAWPGITGDLTFKVTLNEPERARFDVRLSPVGVVQELPVSSGEPADKDLKEFILHTKLPDAAYGGDGLESKARVRRG
jgi:hypothetical protein